MQRKPLCQKKLTQLRPQKALTVDKACLPIPVADRWVAANSSSPGVPSANAAVRAMQE